MDIVSRVPVYSFPEDFNETGYVFFCQNRMDFYTVSWVYNPPGPVAKSNAESTGNT